MLDGLPGIPDEVVDRIAAAASPDVALEALSDLAGVLGAERLWDVLRDEDVRERMILVLGTSEALGEFLVRHPEAVEDLRTLPNRPLSLAEFRARMEEAEDAAPADAETNADMLRVKISPGVARAFAKRALRVVAAGRPPCPLCGNPLDPEGHICPRQNGHLHAG